MGKTTEFQVIHFRSRKIQSVVENTFSGKGHEYPPIITARTDQHRLSYSHGDVSHLSLETATRQLYITNASDHVHLSLCVEILPTDDLVLFHL
jgi:hypothetical protein